MCEYIAVNRKSLLLLRYVYFLFVVVRFKRSPESRDVINIDRKYKLFFVFISFDYLIKI